MRAISSVLDVALFLLLVSAAVATVTIPHDSPPETDVGAMADTLGSARYTVEYPVSLAVEYANGSGGTVSDERTAYGTVANLLADAAISEATLGGRPTPGFGAFRQAVRNRTRRVLGWADAAIRVEVRWRPYLGSPLNGTVSIGPRPTGDVMTATIDVASPVDAVRGAAIRSASDGYAAVARVVATATVRGLYPRRRMRLALQGGGVARGLAVRRYRSLLGGLDLNVTHALQAGLVGTVNGAMREALAARFERDMRRRFETPLAAAQSVRAGRVRVVLWGWER